MTAGRRLALARAAAGPPGGGGSGLAGLRERVDALGGSVHAGPAGKGRWFLRADLPWEPSRAGGPG